MHLQENDIALAISNLLRVVRKNGVVIITYRGSATSEIREDGKLYMKMVYNGPSMPLIQSLKISRPMPVPEKLSRRFTKDGQVQLNAGTVYLDKNINGFWIPVSII